MSIETDAPEAAAADDSVEALATELGDAIADSPAYRRFEEAKAAVQNDEEAQARISEFEQLRQEFAMAKQAGQADQETMEKVQAAQQELHSLPVMREYVEAQDELEDRLEALNRAISDPLAVDFGGKAGGCCHD
ncbi:YlbF family regulator [Halobaculum magnesiiphilum]|uniref:YlbF family regulator n=1 Tax=Halobaculum magnesiiphilum TaxID=1017351 RepID=A0A8T8WF70_9EURY|nr:YlbF family regulator [Halobaculum magnesiiphilum]QZP38384.1 YlbF family regulator [Halobaculum magnesiiphilum]